MVDFKHFHEYELPERIRSGNGALACADLRRVPRLGLKLSGGGAYTYRPTLKSVEIDPGLETAELVVELSPDAWHAFVQEYRSVPGLLYAGLARIETGNPLMFVRWEPALRALYHGRPVVDPNHCLIGSWEPGLSFEPNSDPTMMRRFLDEMGYLRVRQVFMESEVEVLRNETDWLRAETAIDDPHSWWGENRTGEKVLTRITYAGDRSPRIATLYDDLRVLRLIRLSEHPLRASRDRVDGVTLLFKNRDMTAGLSDLPWHRDCGLGGHSVICPTLIVGIHLGATTPENGDLRVIPGSWRGTCHAIDTSSPNAPRGISLGAEAGDCTLHYGDLMHAAPPPMGNGGCRTTLYLTFLPPQAFEHIGAYQAYNDVLLGNSDRKVSHLRDLTPER